MKNIVKAMMVIGAASMFSGNAMAKCYQVEAYRTYEVLDVEDESGKVSFVCEETKVIPCDSGNHIRSTKKIAEAAILEDLPFKCVKHLFED